MLPPFVAPTPPPTILSLEVVFKPSRTGYCITVCGGGMAPTTYICCALQPHLGDECAQLKAAAASQTG